MKVFISWSRDLSLEVATKLRTWLRGVIQALDPWMSSEDIPAGKIWFGEISANITQAKYSILCVTKGNQNSPWLLWEAGALYRGFEDTARVVPFLIDLKKDELGPPLSHFQVIDAQDRKDVERMLASINAQLPSPLAPEILDTQVKHYWNDLQNAISDAITNNPYIEGSESSCAYTFKQAAEKFMSLPGKMPESIRRDRLALQWPRHYIDKLPLDRVTNDALQQYKDDRLGGTTPVVPGIKSVGAVKPGTVNKELRTVIAVLNRAVDWGWISHAPRIKHIPRSGERRPYVLRWDEQDRLFSKLPAYVRAAALLAVNTGLRKSIISDLEWSWLQDIPGFGKRVFVIPPGYRGWQNGKLVFLNSIAVSVLENQPTKNEKYVFKGKQGGKFIFGRAWLMGWERANLPSGNAYSKGLDNLRRTFEHRLKVARVSPDDREFLLWSKKALDAHVGRDPDYKHLLACIEKVTERKDGTIINL